jgi:FAD synthase
MRIQLSTSDSFAREPALTVIGTWDPLLKAQRELFQKLARRGSVAGLTPVVIILFPSPAKLVNPGSAACLEYSDLRARVALIRECAAVKVLTVRMTARDLDASSRSFFDLISSCIRLRELWMGANQSLGRCRQGSIGAIADFARKRRISLRRLEVCKECNAGGVLRLLGEGKLRSAIKRVGLAPMWQRPRSGVLKLNWPPGGYLVVPTSRPSLAPVQAADPVAVKIASGEKGGTMKWPARDIEWISFVAGPADR